MTDSPRGRFWKLVGPRGGGAGPLCSTLPWEGALLWGLEKKDPDSKRFPKLGNLDGCLVGAEGGGRGRLMSGRFPGSCRSRSLHPLYSEPGSNQSKDETEESTRFVYCITINWKVHQSLKWISFIITLKVDSTPTICWKMNCLKAGIFSVFSRISLLYICKVICGMIWYMKNWNSSAENIGFALLKTTQHFLG